MKAISSIITQFFAILLIGCAISACSESKRTASIKDEAPEARGLEIYRQGDSWVAKVISPSDSTKDLGVYIFPDAEDSKNLPEIAGAHVFPPSKRKSILLYSSVYSSVIKELDSQEIIKAVGDADYFTDPDITDGLKNGKIIDVGSSQEPIAEKIIATKPDMILVSHFDGFDASKFEKFGVPIIYLRESSEVTPLGRAEWIKLLGLICNQKEKADKIYNAVSKEYASLKSKAAGANAKPTVMTETMFEGTWFLPGGKSYAAAMIEDAGGKYIWDDDTSAGSLQMSFEAVLERGAEADIWLIRVFDEELSIKGLEAKDSRYLLFKPANSGGVWSVNTKAVPFYDETPFHPERLLKDYIAIFHPELLPKQSPRYFKRAK